MSKKSFKSLTELNKVRAIPTKKTDDGRQLYRFERVHKSK